MWTPVLGYLTLCLRHLDRLGPGSFLLVLRFWTAGERFPFLSDGLSLPVSLHPPESSRGIIVCRRYLLVDSHAQPRLLLPLHLLFFLAYHIEIPVRESHPPAIPASSNQIRLGTDHPPKRRPLCTPASSPVALWLAHPPVVTHPLQSEPYSTSNRYSTLQLYATTAGQD